VGAVVLEGRAIARAGAGAGAGVGAAAGAGVDEFEAGVLEAVLAMLKTSVMIRKNRSCLLVAFARYRHS
jgi:hypothetical protein